MARMTHWRFAALAVIYLVVIPAALIYIAITAQNGLKNDHRQDAELRAQVKVDRKLARQNCQRAYALLDYFLAVNAISSNAGSPYAPLIRPEINKLIDRFNELDGCAPQKR